MLARSEPIRGAQRAPRFASAISAAVAGNEVELDALPPPRAPARRELEQAHEGFAVWMKETVPELCSRTPDLASDAHTVVTGSTLACAESELHF